MELRDFLSSSHINDQWQSSVICFTGISYPVLFFSHVRAYLRKKYSIVTLDPSDETLHINLSMSLMGEENLYWISSLEEVSKKEQKELCTLLSTYAGPHRIVVFIPAELSNMIQPHWLTIKIPDSCDKSLLHTLANWFNGEEKNKLETTLFTALFKQKNTMSLDDACLFIYYQSVVGKNTQVFIDQWLPHLVIPSTSLFGLSQSLFSHNANMFWKQWKQVYLQFSPQFWIVFWSEQFWRASSYNILKKNQQEREAKIISAKLPFSFIQRDWQRYSTSELNNAHDYIYTLDYNLKHGATDYGFDLFYTKFFLHDFKNV